MKRMTKAEAMAQIHALNTNLPPQLEGERHLARYLEKIIVALEPLADNDPVDEVASKLLFEWTDLFTYQEHDDQNLRGLPELMLAMGAHLFHTEWEEKFLPIKGIYRKGTSTITRLPKWSLSKTKNVNDEQGIPLLDWGSTPYFFRAFLIPYFNQYEDVRAFKAFAETENPIEIYTKYLTGNSDERDKEKLMKNLKQHQEKMSPFFVIEALSDISRKETLLSHIIKIGKTSHLLSEEGKHFLIYKGSFPYGKRITHESLAELMRDYETNQTSRPHPHHKQDKRRQGLSNEENTLFSETLTELLEKQAWDKLEYLVDLGAPTQVLTQHLQETTQAALNSTNPEERTAHIATIKRMIALGANADGTLNDFVRYLGAYKQNYGAINPLPDDIFQALYSCSLYDINLLSRTQSDFHISILLIAALLSSATHPTRRALRDHYRQTLESNQSGGFLAAIYCAAQTKLHARFFGLTQATFERLFLTECDGSFACISELFRAMRYLFGDSTRIAHFKNGLINAIGALSPAAKLKLRNLINTKKTCLAVAILKTRRHHNTQKDTTHFNTLISRLTLTGRDYLNYDSSDDEAEKAEDSFEPTDDQNTAIHIFKDLTPVLRKPVEFYLHLLNQRLHLASAIVESGHFDVNEPVNWIQQNINGVTLNYADGSIALKLWADTQAPVQTSVEEKIRLTQFLIEHGLSIFSLLDAVQGLKALGENDTQRALSDFVKDCCETGTLEGHFHKIPLNNLTKLYGKYERNAPHQKELSALIAGDRPLPITALLHLCQSSIITEEAIKKHFMQPLTEAQTLGLMHLLKAVATPAGSRLPSLQHALTEQIGNSPDLVAEFKKIKDSKTTCALFMILKYQPAYYLPFFQRRQHHTNQPLRGEPLHFV